MYSEFAYSRIMQVILAIIATVSAYIFIYMIANLMLRLYGEKASTRQKSIFAFLIGVILNQAWVYLIYFIGGANSFSNMVYALVVTPNPVFAYLYYLIGIRVLKLSRTRSIRLMGHVYLYYILIKSLTRLIGSIFFIQPYARYNYALDAAKQLTSFAVMLIIYFLTQKIMERYKYTIKLNLFLNRKNELVKYLVQASAIYAIMVLIPYVISEEIAAHAVVFLLFSLIMAFMILWDMYSSLRNDAENRAVHIGVLSEGALSDGVGDVVELQRRMDENPSLVSILLSRHDYAEKLNVKMRMELRSYLGRLSMDNVDVCEAVGCLLNNAIEAAARSEQRRVTVTIESKGGGRMLIIINNTIASPINADDIIFRGVEGKRNRKGGGLATVHRIVSENENCAFQLACNNYEVLAYLEIQRRDSGLS